MDILRRWLRAPASGSGEVAKERLRLVLIHNRLDISPDALDELKRELLSVLTRYFDIDQSSLLVDVHRGDKHSQLVTTISVKRQL
jgi:cell division topological specificity factor